MTQFEGEKCHRCGEYRGHYKGAVCFGCVIDAQIANDQTRIIACSCCGGDGGGFEGGNERWIKCVACDGKGEFETELEPVTMEDLG